MRFCLVHSGRRSALACFHAIRPVVVISQHESKQTHILGRSANRVMSGNGRYLSPPSKRSMMGRSEAINRRRAPLRHNNERRSPVVESNQFAFCLGTRSVRHNHPGWENMFFGKCCPCCPSAPAERLRVALRSCLWKRCSCIHKRSIDLVTCSAGLASLREGRTLQKCDCASYAFDLDATA